LAVVPPPPGPAAPATRATRRRRLLSAACAVIAAAVLIRFWSEKQPGAADARMTLQEAERRARAAPNDEEAQMNWGVLLHKAGRFEEAAEAFDRARRIAPNDAQPYGWRALAAFALKQPEQAKASSKEPI